MSQPPPPDAVLMEFLRALSETVNPYDPITLILRGSLLLRHWFGASARPAADIDLECFEKVPGNRGPRFPSLIDHARGLCCCAADDHARHHAAVEFQEIDAPADGQSLWTYGSPGERFFVGWRYDGGNPSGQLQIDLAQANTYGLNDIPIADIRCTAADGAAFAFPAYTPEMLLAAKLSWLLRSLTRKADGHELSALVWKGEPKDLFDAHLLLTRADLRAQLLQKALLAVGSEDQLQWNHLDVLFDVQRVEMSDEDFPNWPAFRARYEAILPCGPAEMLQTIAERVEPLLGDFYRRAEMPFLLAINADPIDEVAYLVYADWLEERGDPRGEFLRQFTRFYFGERAKPRGGLLRRLTRFFIREEGHSGMALRDIFRVTSPPWLHQLFGSAARLREMRQYVEGRAS